MLYTFNFVDGVYDISDELLEKIKNDVDEINAWSEGVYQTLEDIGILNIWNHNMPYEIETDYHKIWHKKVIYIIEKYFPNVTWAYMPIDNTKLKIYECTPIKLEET